MTTPAWLLQMRAITGTTETAGSASNPKIMAMVETIAQAYPEMAPYCALYTDDSVPWCGLAIAYCMTQAGIRPVFGPTDTDKFLWAQAWDDPSFATKISSPRLGCVVVMGRDGGGHVSLYESTSGSNYICRGGNQSDTVNTSSYPISNVISLVWPTQAGPPPPAPPRELKKGDSGDDVAALQTVLGIPADGEFGEITETQVEAFQAACNLDVDGVVGPATWQQVDALKARLDAGYWGLPDELGAAIVAMVDGSALADYTWDERGKPPPGYLAGMCLAYAVAVMWLDDHFSWAKVMARAAGNPDTDALAWYEAELSEVMMDVDQAGVDTLRALFAILISLGMRESSGRYCEGRDMSASNVSADTAEAGLFQSSWNFHGASSEIDKLFDYYWSDPHGFLDIFNEDIEPTAANLSVYGGSGQQGTRYQWLAKYSPAFAVMSTAIGLRTIRQHWGPINRKELDADAFVPCDDLLYEVQKLVQETPPEPEPAPEPEPPEAATVAISATGNVVVTVNGQVVFGED
jgi:uncharacterized protein (TIGR02594 family)